MSHVWNDVTVKGTDAYGAEVEMTWSMTVIRPRLLRLGRALHRAWRKSPSHWPRSHTRFGGTVLFKNQPREGAMSWSLGVQQDLEALHGR